MRSETQPRSDVERSENPDTVAASAEAQWREHLNRSVAEEREEDITA